MSKSEPKDSQRWRSISVYLSDKEAEKLCRIAAEHGCTVSEIVNAYVRELLSRKQKITLWHSNFLKYLAEENKLSESIKSAEIDQGVDENDDKLYETLHAYQEATMFTFYQEFCELSGKDYIPDCMIEAWDEFYDWYSEYRSIMN